MSDALRTGIALQVVLGSWTWRRGLQPSDDLAWDARQRRWELRSEQAWFTTPRGNWLPGWYMIELVGERTLTSVAASFRFETGARSIEADLPLRVGKPSKRLVYLPPGVRRLAFRPMNAEGGFRLHGLRLVWVTPWFARDRLLQRLINIHPAYRDLAPTQARARVAERARAWGLTWRRAALEDYDATYLCLSLQRHYRLWTRRFERLPEARALPEPCPRYWLVVPLAADALLEDVEATLRSLQAQQVSNWRLMLLWPPARRQAGADLEATLGELLAEEPRAMLLATDAPPACSESQAVWIGMMRAGDRLAEHALGQHARAARASPAALLIYADEDELDAEGQRHSPCFKPAWNPDLLLSSPYLGRALWVRADALGDLLPVVDWPQQGEEDGWLARLALAALARPPGSRVHVDGILYHRATPQVLRPAQDYAALVREAVARQGVTATVVAGRVVDSARVAWPLPSPAPLVSLLVPTRDGVDILRPCVDAILARTDYRHFELLILDNQSGCAQTLAYMDEVARRDARVRVLRWDHPFNYSAINNFGAENSRGEIIGLINNDVEPMDGEWLGEMVSQACRPEIGCVGAKLYYPNGTIQHAGVILGVGGVAGHAHRFFRRDEDGYCGRLKLVHNLSAVTAACLLLRREVFERVGGLNEPDLAVAYNDVDLCLKVQAAGYRNLWTPYAELYHHESISRGADDTPTKRARALKEARYMRRQWGKLLDRDPAYNANLTLAHEDFSLRQG